MGGVIARHVPTDCFTIIYAEASLLHLSTLRLYRLTSVRDL